MQDRLIADLSAYLADEPDCSALISFSAKRAVRSFQQKRNYPTEYDQGKISADMEKCYDCIFDLALYFLVKQGGDFQKSHSENSVNRTWESETDIYVNHGVFPFAH